VPLVTQHLLDEVADVLARPKIRRYVDAATAEAFVAELKRLAEWHNEPVAAPAVCRDPDDDYLLALAVASKADALVSGDQDLHAVEGAAVEIITPRELLDRLGF
jgi:putative PIN family toxin of toxin-antitoxin system